MLKVESIRERKRSKVVHTKRGGGWVRASLEREG